MHLNGFMHSRHAFLRALSEGMGGTAEKQRRPMKGGMDMPV